MRASATGEVIFENCRLPQAQLLGSQGEGFVDSLRILDGGRISIAALSLGMAQGAYDAALRYSKQRKQFGRPISEFQAIQYKLADMATEIDAARLLIYRAGGCTTAVSASPRNPPWPSCSPPRWRWHRRPGTADSRRLRIHQRLSG